MAGKIFLIHWNLQEAEELARGLRSDGWEVDVEAEDGLRAYQHIKATLPDGVVIYLSRLPAHGHKTAVALHSVWTTHNLPIIFVDGNRGAIARTRVDVPDAVFTTTAKLGRVLAGLSRRGRGKTAEQE